MTCMLPALLASAVLASALTLASPPASATPAAADPTRAPGPWFDPAAVEGGLIPRLDASRLSSPVRLCGWWDNPTPGNVWLDDRSGQWTIALQGMYEAHGETPTFGPDQQWPKGAPHGDACACLTARVDRESRYVYSFTDAQARPLKACLSDPALKGRRPD